MQENQLRDNIDFPVFIHYLKTLNPSVRFVVAGSRKGAEIHCSVSPNMLVLPDGFYSHPTENKITNQNNTRNGAHLNVHVYYMMASVRQAVIGG